MDKETTRTLQNILKDLDSERDLRSYMDRISTSENEALPFHKYIATLPAFQNAKISDIIRVAGIERTYGYQIFNGRRAPGRDKVIMIGLALHLTIRQIQTALESAKVAQLYSRDRRDAVLIFGITKGLSVDAVNELLYDFGLDILK